MDLIENKLIESSVNVLRMLKTTFTENAMSKEKDVQVNCSTGYGKR